jgi:basic membrane lipoprotein Med (substrate-binding protein (PBP1-ABC) superfamily)
VIASAVTAIPEAFAKIAVAVKSHAFRPGMIEFGMRDGMVHVVLNPQLTTRIPPAALARMNQAEHDIETGALVVLTN